jgi:hypothetical protein
MLLTTMGFFFPSPKVAQLLSNLFINVIDNNGFFFHSSLRMPQLSLNLTNVVNNNEFSML